MKGGRRARGASGGGALIGRPPHYERVRALLGALDAPVVELWGWPGTGKRAILAALLEDEPDARFMPSAWLALPERLEERLTRAVGRRSALLVCEGKGDAAAIRGVASWLRPGQRLVVAVERRLDLGRGALATPVEDLLLRPDEIGALWRASTGRELAASEEDRLEHASDGWHFLLSMWARDPATASAPIDDNTSFGFDSVADFLRERVLAVLDAGELGVARELARGDSARKDAGGERCESARRSLVERVGLARPRDGELRLPRALAAYLAGSNVRAAPSESGGEDVHASDASPSSSSPRRADADAATAIDSTHMAPIRRNWRDEREEVAADVRIGLLGLPRVERRDARGALVPVEWSFKRPLRILAYLASAPDLQASREEIVSILWPESSEDAIRRNLHPAISWLRRSVRPGGGSGGVVLLRDGVYSLDPTLHWDVDVRRFLERVEDGARHLARGRTEEAEASWEAAWRLYQGAFLQGWSERWVLAQRDELQLRFTDLLRRLGELKAQLGRLTEAEDAYRTLLLEDPLEEGVHVAIMRIYGARGRRDLVNRQYQRLREVLRQELGVDPSPPTLEVFNDLMLAPVPRR